MNGFWRKFTPIFAMIMLIATTSTTIVSAATKHTENYTDSGCVNVTASVYDITDKMLSLSRKNYNWCTTNISTGGSEAANGEWQDGDDYYVSNYYIEDRPYYHMGYNCEYSWSDLIFALTHYLDSDDNWQSDYYDTYVSSLPVWDLIQCSCGKGARANCRYWGYTRNIDGTTHYYVTYASKQTKCGGFGIGTWAEYYDIAYTDGAYNGNAVWDGANSWNNGWVYGDRANRTFTYCPGHVRTWYSYTIDVNASTDDRGNINSNLPATFNTDWATDVTDACTEKNAGSSYWVNSIRPNDDYYYIGASSYSSNNLQKDQDIRLPFLKKYFIYFNSNGGTMDSDWSNLTINSGENLGITRAGRSNDGSAWISPRLNYSYGYNVKKAHLDGYTFTGWYTESSGGTKVYDANGNYVYNNSSAIFNTSKQYKGNYNGKTLYAHYTPNWVPLNLDSNGATYAGTTSVSALVGSTSMSPSKITIPMKKYHIKFMYNRNSSDYDYTSNDLFDETRPSANFDGYSNNGTEYITSYGTGLQNTNWFRNGGTLYAGWSGNFHMNEPKRAGYTFKGWYANSTYANWSEIERNVPCNKALSSLDSFTWMSDGYMNSNTTRDVILYAKWQADSVGYVTVHNFQNIDGSYPLSGEQLTAKYWLNYYRNHKSEFSVNGDCMTLNKFSESSLSGYKIDIRFKETSTWVVPSISGHKGFSNPASQRVIVAGDETTCATYNYTRNSYNFTVYSAPDTCSNYSDDCEGNISYNGSMSLSGNVIMTADHLNYSDTGYNWYYSGGSEPYVNKVLKYGEYFNPSDINQLWLNTGHTFNGYHDKYGNRISIDGTLRMGSEDMFAYADWTDNKYSIVFHSNDGENANSSASATYTPTFVINMPNNINTTYDAKFNMPSNIPSCDGYTFVGWSTSPSNAGDTNSFMPGRVVNSLTTEPDGRVDLYAIWRANNYTVTFNAGNHGVGNMITKPVTFGSPVTFYPSELSNTFSRVGYVFGGWNTNVVANMPSRMSDARGTYFSSTNYNGNLYGTVNNYMNSIVSEHYSLGNSSGVDINNFYNAIWSPVKITALRDIYGGRGSKFNVNLTAVWLPREDITYTIRHYYQPEDVAEGDYSAYEENVEGNRNYNSGLSSTHIYTGVADDVINSDLFMWTYNKDFDDDNTAHVTVACKDVYDYGTESSYTYQGAYDLSYADGLNDIAIAADGSTVISVYHNRVIPDPPVPESNNVENGVILGNGVAHAVISPTSSKGLANISNKFGLYYAGQLVSFDAVLKDGYHWSATGNEAPFDFGPYTNDDSSGKTTSHWTRKQGNMYTSDTNTNLSGQNVRYDLSSVSFDKSWSGKTTNESTYFRVDATNNKYTIHYDANVPTGSFSTLTGSTGDTYCLYDVDFTFADNGYNLTGYDFVGWSRTPQSYSSIDYKAGQVYTNLTDSYDLTNNDGAEITLYAVWKARTDTPYVVRHYLQNIGDGENHSTDYVLKDETRAVATTDSPLTFATNHYTGFYPAQILTNDNGVARSVDVEPYYIGNINPRLDYDITVQVDGDGVTYVDFWYNRIYYRLGDDNFKFTYDVGNDVNGHSSTQTNHHGWYQYDENISITATMLLGYDWVNWTSDTDAGIVFAKDKEYSFNMPAHNLQLTPNTKEHVFSISYDYDGGSVTVPNPTTYTVTTGAFTVNEPIKTGYTHIGWALDTDTYGSDWTNKGSWNNYSDMFSRTHYMNYTYLPGDLRTAVYTPSTIAAKLVITPKTSSYSNPNWEGVGDRKYTAQYMAHQYYVHYDANVPDYCTSTLVGTMTDSLHTYDDYWRTPRAGAQTNLNKNTYSLMGYTFIGWNTKPDGTGEFYADEAHHMTPTGVNNQEASVARHNMTANDGEVVTLYAQWKAHEYNVVLNANDGEVTVDEANDSVLAGTPIGREADNSDIRKYINLKTGNGVIASTYDNQKRDNTVNGAIGVNVANPLTTCVTLPVMNVYQEADDGLYVKDTRVSTATGVTSHFYRLADEDELADTSIQKYGIATYRRVGFNFLGWSKTPTGKNLESSQWLNDVNLNPVKLLHDGEEIKNLTANSEQVTLYAIWEPRPFTTIKAASSMYSGTMSSEVYEEKAKELNIQSVQDARSIDTSECIQQYQFTNKDSIKRTK